jgi:hypothetical protein
MSLAFPISSCFPAKEIDDFYPPTAYSITLTDTVLAKDCSTKTPLKTCTDASKTTEFLKKYSQKNITETSKSIDYIKKLSLKILIDKPIAIDYAFREISRMVIDKVIAEFSISIGKRYSIGLTDIGKSFDYIKKETLRIFSDYSKTMDYISKDFERKFIEITKSTDYIKKLSSKKFIESIVSIDYISKTTFKKLMEAVILADYITKLFLKILMPIDGILAEFYISKESSIKMQDVGKTTDYISKLSLKTFIDISKVIDYIIARRWYFISLIDRVSPEFVISRKTLTNIREINKVIEYVGKDLVKNISDFARIIDFRGVVKTLFDKFIDLGYVAKGIAPVLSDESLMVDILIKEAFKLCGYDVKRAYFHPVWYDIIEPFDHNARVEASKVLLDSFKRVGGKLEITNDEIKILEDLVTKMEYVEKGQYVYARHPNIFYDYSKYALDLLKRIYDAFKSKTGKTLKDVEFWISMAEGRVSYMEKRMFGDVVAPKDHNLIIDALKPIEVALQKIEANL